MSKRIKILDNATIDLNCNYSCLCGESFSETAAWG